MSLLKKCFSDVEHVRNLNLESASDQEIWQFAKDNKFIIATKDSDFWERTVLFGHPPKVIWIRRGNCSTQEIFGLLKENSQHIAEFAKSESNSILSIF